VPDRPASDEALALEDVLSWARLIAGVLCAFAGVIHLGYADAHFAVRHDVGAFFVVVGVGQLAASWFLIYGPPSFYVTVGTAVGLAGVMITYVVSRTAGLPVGPSPGVAESAGLLDLTSVLIEAMAVALLAIVAIGDFARFRAGSETKPHGLSLVAAGMALMLLGLGLDTLMLERDPGSQAGQGLVELSNPAHLLMLAGLIVTGAGMVRAIMAELQSSPAPGRQIAKPGLAVFTLVILLGATGGLAVSSGDGHGHGHAEGAAGHIEGDADHHTQSAEELANDPTFEKLKETLRKGGTLAALSQLEELAATDQAVLREAHPLAHALGRFSFTVYKDAPKAFGQCTAVFASGCYHGVLEEYLRSRPSLAVTDVVGLCNTGIDTVFVKFQCLHGLGHGLTMLFNHDIVEPLKFCDSLASDWERSSCYGGVFMENIVGASHAQDHGGEHKSFIKAEDPLYPCNSVAQKYQYQCYNLQTSAILMFNGYDYGKTARECDKAPGDYALVCYRSLGRDISGSTLRNPDKSLALCQQGTPAYWNECFIGAVKDFINTDQKTEDALLLCQKAPVTAKESCYGGIGEILADLIVDPQARAKECAKAEEGYVAFCRRFARL
jgi:hypothetical protein